MQPEAPPGLRAPRCRVFGRGRGGPRRPVENKRAAFCCAGGLAFGFWVCPVFGQLSLTPLNAVRSVSGQFTLVERADSAGATSLSEIANDANYLRLEPPLTAVACERIKRALSDTLGDRSPWQGKISLTLRPARTAQDEVLLIAEQFPDGWRYRLEVPNPVARKRFVRALAQTMLLEQANRNARDRTAEIPAWLTDGVTEQLLATHGDELLPPAPRWDLNALRVTPTVVNARRRDPLEQCRRVLRQQPPLTLAELSWPTDEQLDGPAGEAYRRSAQLLVTELLRLPDGRACLRRMLAELAQFYNWQTAFHRAFRSHFERPVDWEKWWALTLEHFAGRNPDQTWSPVESWNKLAAALRTPVEVRRARDELPAPAEVPLATVISEWDFLRQSQTLRAKLRELELLRLRVSQDLVGLVDDYRALIAGYLERRNRVGGILPGTKMATPSARNVVQETLRHLAALETRRAELQPAPEADAGDPAATDTPTQP